MDKWVPVLTHGITGSWVAHVAVPPRTSRMSFLIEFVIIFFSNYLLMRWDDQYSLVSSDELGGNTVKL